MQALPQGAAAFGIVQNSFLDGVHAHAADVVASALQVPAFLAVQLQEGAAVLQHFLRRFQLDKKLRHFGFDAAIAGDVNFPATVHADDAHVFDAGFGAIARAATDGQFDFVRGIHAPQGAFQVLAHLGAVLGAKAAPLGAHTGFDRAQGFGIGMATGHADVFPDIDQVFFFHAQQVDALATGDFDRGDLVFIHGIGNAAQFIGGGFAAPHARDHAVGAILLNVGMAALIDVTALRVVLGFFGPGADQVIVQGRAAGGATVGGSPFHGLHHLGERQQLAQADGFAHILVAVVGAAADGFFLGRGRVVATGSEHQDLFDQAGARPTRGAGLGVLANFIECEQALVLDGFANAAFGDAVAAADFGIVGHAGRLAVALVAHIADVGLAKHQLVANVGHAAPLAQQFEVPTAIDGVAVQTSAHQLVIANHQFFVNAFVRVAQHNFFGFTIVAAHEVARTEQVDAGDLELGGGQRAAVAANAKLRQMVGQDFALLEQGRDQAIGDATVRGAFAHRIDARVGDRLHRVADHDAALAMQAHAFGQGGVGADAHGHHHQVGGHFAAVLEANALYPALGATHERLGLCADQKFHAAVLQGLLQQVAGGFVELALHQPGCHMHHGHVHAAFHQAIGRFQTEQAAANHHGFAVLGGGVNHGLGVGNVTVGQHAIELNTWHGQDERVGSGRQQQAVVGCGAFFARAVLGMHDAAHSVHLGHGPSGVQGDAVVAVPVQWVQDDFIQGLLAREHRREQDAVVVGMGLAAEHGDVVQVGRELQQLFQGAHAGHAIAHHDQTKFLRGCHRSLQFQAAFSTCAWRV